MTASSLRLRIASILPRSGGSRANAVAMASGTLLSRVTGVARIIALAYALGLHVGDAFNLANNTPNTLFDLLLGGIIASTMVPVFASRLSMEPEKRAWKSISSVVTLGILILVVTTVAFEFLAAPIIHAYALATHGPGTASVVLLAVDLLRLFAPQLFFYGVIALLTAVLNARHQFAIPAFAPIANNLVSIAVLITFASTYHHPTVQSVLANHGALLLLGIGNTAGVAVQSLFLLPSIRRHASNLRPRFNFADSAVRELSHLSFWSFGSVLLNQAALFIVMAVAFSHRGFVTAYNYAYLFFQLPYAIVSLSIMSVIQPQLASLWSRGDGEEFGRKLRQGLRTAVTITIPFAALYLAGSPLIIRIVLEHGYMSAQGALLTAHALEGFAIGLPGFALYLSAIQACQAIKSMRLVFLLYALENILNIAFALILTPHLGVFGLSLAFGLAYDVAAVAAVLTLRGLGVSLDFHRLIASWGNSLAASVVAGLLTWFIVRASTHASGLSLVAYGLVAVVVALAGFFVVASVGSRMTHRSRR